MSAIRTACRRTCESAIEHELEIIKELKYEAYFLTVRDIMRFARSQRHPLPGARLGGELRRLLLPRGSPT